MSCELCFWPRTTTGQRYLHSFFFFNDTATTEIYTLSLHDALPILWGVDHTEESKISRYDVRRRLDKGEDRKSTRLNSSHPSISYAVFCLKKKKPPKQRYHSGSTMFLEHSFCPLAVLGHRSIVTCAA